jgi:iron(III) transport system substrate-binding protein
VNVWRAGTDKVLQRVLAEAKGNRFDFDLVNMSSPEMEALHRERILQAVKSPYLNDLIPGAVPAHREWAATYINVWVQAYNTGKVKKDELPKNYLDLLDPRWKGILGIESKNQEWFSTVVKEMGEDKGLKFFRDLVAKNGVSVRTGHSLLNNLVVSGEVPLALTVYSFMPEQAKQKGAPVEWFAIEPAIATSFSIGLSRKAPHPHAAVLFYDYMITDAQKLLAQLQVVPSSAKIESPVKHLKIKLVDPNAVLDESEKWKKLYEDIILRQARK